MQDSENTQTVYLEGEIWVSIKGLEGRYEVSSVGRVKSLKRPDSRGYVKPEFISYGSGKQGQYKRFPMIDKNGKTHWKRVHQLVAEAFISNPNNLPEVNHKDGIKSNNQISNLEWTTGKDNIKHAIETGLITPYFKYPNETIRRIRESKLSNSEIAKIYGMDYRYAWMIRKNMCRSNI